MSFRPEFEEGKKDENGNVLIIKRPYQAEYDRLKGLEITYEEHALFIDECKRAGIKPMTTVFTIDTVKRIAECDWNIVKVAGYDCGSLSLIKELSNYFDELIISTGATYDSDIERTAAYLNVIKKKFTLLHCVTIYPTPLGQMHLNRINYLREFTPSVGLSEHTLVARDGVKATLAAIYFGADTVERHFTVLPEDETRDGKVLSKSY